MLGKQFVRLDGGWIMSSGGLYISSAASEFGRGTLVNLVVWVVSNQDTYQHEGLSYMKVRI
jgi:hypothetical protein